MTRCFTVALLLFGLVLPATARAESDWFASLYTNDGIELRADERVFALFSLLNAMGYDEAPVLREFPVRARELHPIRRQVTGSLTLDPGQVEKLDAFFDAHQKPADEYARYALTLQGPGGFERTDASPEGLKGLEAFLAEGYSRQKLGDLFAGVQAEYRSGLKAYHPVIDAPITSLRKLLKMNEDEPPRVVLAINLLDGRGKAYSLRSGDELTVVVGPSQQPDLLAVAHQFARDRLAPMIAKAGPLKGLVELAAAAEAAGPHEFALEAMSRAFAAAALNLSGEQIEPLAARGYHGVVEIHKAIDGFSKGDKPLDAFVTDSMLALALAKEAPRDSAAPSGTKALVGGKSK